MYDSLLPAHAHVMCHADIMHELMPCALSLSESVRTFLSRKREAGSVPEALKYLQDLSSRRFMINVGAVSVEAQIICL